MKYYIGIDGGGTKTNAVLLDDTGKIYAAATGRGINYNAIGMEAARMNLKAVTDSLLQDFSGTISAAAVGCAALSDKADEQTTNALCGGVIPCENILLDSDVFIALSAAPDPEPKAIAICGTGSMAAGILTDGRRVTAGGWGHILGDEGSGYALSLEAIRTAIRASEGILPNTELINAVCDYFHIDQLTDLIGLFYGSAIPRDTVAAFAPRLFACAEAGDAAAITVIQTQGKAFADTCASLLARMPDGTPLYLWGGIFEHHELFRKTFSAYLQNIHPDVKISLLPLSPEIGAVHAAMETEETDG